MDAWVVYRTAPMALKNGQRDLIEKSLFGALRACGLSKSALLGDMVMDFVSHLDDAIDSGELRIQQVERGRIHEQLEHYAIGLHELRANSNIVVEVPQ